MGHKIVLSISMFFIIFIFAFAGYASPITVIDMVS